MLRITKTHREGKWLLKLEGRLVEPWIQELEEACSGGRPELVLDLSGVSFADSKGIKLIRRLREEGASIMRLSLFLGGLVDPLD